MLLDLLVLLDLELAKKMITVGLELRLRTVVRLMTILDLDMYLTLTLDS